MDNIAQKLPPGSSSTTQTTGQSRKRKLPSQPTSLATYQSEHGEERKEQRDHDQQQEPLRRQRQKGSFKVPEFSLGDDYRPLPNDVICQRGHEAKNWPGNQTFRYLVQSNLERYQSAESKKDKTMIVSSIVDSIRSTSPPGKFVRKQKDGRWYETGDDFAREKVGQG